MADKRILFRVLENVLIYNNTTNSTDSNSTNLLEEKHVWGVGIATAIGYLIFSFLLTSCIVLCFRSKKINKSCLNFVISSLVSLAIGSLIGDASVHIIPEIFGAHKHDETENHKEEDEPNPHIVSFMIIIGFFTFFSLEKIFLWSGCGHSHGHDDHENEHEHGHGHDDHSHQNKKDENINHSK
jgi:hypothetical protein